MSIDSYIAGPKGEMDWMVWTSMIETPKLVFTKTLKKSDWVNTALATGDITDEIMRLKSESN